MEQVPVKTGPALTVEQVVLFQLLGTDQFYDSLPPGFEDMRDRGKAVYREAVDAVMQGKNCLGCSTLGKAMNPYQNELGQRLAAVQRADPQALEPLALLIAAKRGYRPTPITLYYKDTEGRITPLRF